MSGTYQDKRVPAAVKAVFLAAALVLVAVPSVGMLWARTDATIENRELAPVPRLLAEGGGFNVNFLAECGAYFDDHYAFRDMLVTANSRLRAALGTSSTDQVVVGSDGWLYYGGTLNDYLGRSALSDRSLANIAHNLRLAQGYVESKGASFAFAVAPNKNTLYDANMPPFYLRSPDPSNAERLAPFLQAEGVSYVDLLGLLGAQDETLYLHRDSHWDNRGALLAADALLGGLGKGPLPIDPAAAEARDDFVGDLENMLYPAEKRAEVNYYYAGYNSPSADGAPLAWDYVEGEDVTDSWVQTSGDGSGSLLMFRDSFGNALVPFLASAFEQAAFSKLVPYNLPEMTRVGADCVLIERAERHLSDLATAPPVMPAPVLAFESGLPAGAVEADAAIEASDEGSYRVFRGVVNAPLEPGSRIVLAVEREGADPVVYSPFWTSMADDSGAVVDDRGFVAYVPLASVGDAAVARAYVW